MEMLGSVLLTKDGEKPISEVLARKTHIGLYFSAHWCPPCQAFTPQLSDSYTKCLKGKGLEIVFVSSDRGEQAFQAYYDEMPWTALPFADRDRKEELSKKFKVSGIPTLVILDAAGTLVTKEGRSAVSGDAAGTEFPWKPKTIMELLAGDVLTKSGAKKPLSSVADGKVLGLYFSAHWCPPCRGFTPKLAAQYKKIKDAGLPFEIVFVSSDRDETAFKEYYGEMPWLALPYESRSVKEQLSNKFGVSGIPSLVLLDKDRSTITTSGRGAVMGALADFPWHPEPIADLAKEMDGLNETPSVVLLCDGAEKSAQEAAYKALEPIAEEVRKRSKESGDDPELSFFIATSGDGPIARIRELCGLPSATTKMNTRRSGGVANLIGKLFICGKAKAPMEPEQKVPVAPTVLLLDIPDNGGFYLPALSEITERSLRRMLEDYKSKTLERKQLQG
jgi:nucleoredoxin